ncbi:MAG: MBG domain-containing protein, partial [Thermoguttaceae bacterium]
MRKLAGRCGCSLGAAHKHDRHVRRRLLRIEPLEVRTLLSTYTVTNTNDSGTGSLQQAITDANSNLGLDTIAFNIAGSGVHTITPDSALPFITDPVVINGYTQSGASANTLSVGDNAVIEIEINGSLLSGANGFTLWTGSSGSTISGLAINNFVDNSGIYIKSNSNVITGNFIGTDPTGQTAAGNSIGVRLSSVQNNTIGGTTADARNIISGNSDYGIFFNSSANSNSIVGNYIGTNAAGNAAIGNDYGIMLQNNQNNTIGGTSSGVGNVISGNTSEGIMFSNANSNTIAGNYIGTNAAGNAAIGNYYGITMQGSQNNIIGGTANGSRNVISGNSIGIYFASSNSNTIAGNYIGTNAAGNAAVNNGNAIMLYSGQGNVIGGTQTGAGNIIQNSTYIGVTIYTSTTGTSLLGNSIYASGGLGIDLNGDGVTPNDLGDGDSGANNLQNFPVLTSATTGGSYLTVEGSLNSIAGTTFRIEVFANSVADSSGYGEGQVYLGSFNVTTDGSGNVNFTQSLSAGVAVGKHISATATNLTTNDTSEFARCITAAAPGISVTPTSGLTTTEGGGTAQFSVALTSAPSDNVTIGISSNDTTEGTVSLSSLTFTTANWSTPQTVTVTGVDDSFIDGNIAYTIVTAPASSNDPNYNGLDAADVSVTNTDNDTYNTIYVDTNSDASDGDTSSIAALYANKGTDGKISLREAITAANNTVNGPSGPDRIYFNISGTGVHTISLNSALPAVTSPIIIDGTTDPQFTSTPVVVITRGTMPYGTTALTLDLGSSGSTVRGLVINSIMGNGLSIISSNNTIVGNFFGTDASGTTEAGTMYGSAISIGGSNNTIGSTTAADRNLISSSLFGISVNGTGNIIQGNYIGTDITGTLNLGNGYSGISVTASNNVIGGTATGAGNLIRYSGYLGGVSITSNTATGVSILGNSIYSNNNLGIDLGTTGVTANDLGDGDTGANNLQNFPVLTSANTNGSTISIGGTLNSNASRSYRIDFFANSAADPTGYGEGQTYLGYTNITTDGSGNAAFAVNFTTNVAVGAAISTTATDLTTNDTSEFSHCLTAAAPGISVTPTSGLTTTEAGGTAQFSVALTSAPSANVSIGISSSDTTEGTVSTSSLTFTTANWNTPQTVTVTGVDDTYVDGNIAYTIVTAAASSTDANYNGLDPSNVSVTNTDNDTYNTIYVDTNTDVIDGDTSSIAALYSNKGADGKISLREAITAANNTANGSGGPDRIYFNIAGSGVHTISPTTTLPNIIDTVIIDATTQTGYNGTPLIEINGTNAGGWAFKLNGNSGGSTIKGFTINRCGSYGVWTQSDGNTISDNWIGLNNTGTAASSARYGIYLSSSLNNVVHNVLSGNSDGIYFGNIANGNTIAGNYIGTNPAGTAAISNGYGVRISSGTGNTIGGTTAADRNIISGYTTDAIYITSDSNTVIGNYVGTDYTGTAAIHNTGGYGIEVSGANNVIGAPNAGNVVSAGVAGIMIVNASGTKIQGNYVGLNAAGTAALSNSDRGIYLKNSTNTLIGGTDVADRNVISGNLNHGIHITSSSNNNIVEGNYIGTDYTGNVAIGNLGSTIDIDSGNGNMIGAPGAGNVIVASGDQGIKIDSVSGTVIQGNYIGVGANGTTPLGNTGDAVWLSNATNTTIGGTSTGMGNIIANSLSGTVGHNGVEINGTSLGVAILGNSIYGNAGLGIDLGGDGVTANNGTKNASLPNYDMDFPVIVHAWLNGTSLTLNGYVGSAPNQSTFANALVEFFQSDNSSSGYGQGRKYLGCLTTVANGNFSGTLTVSGIAKGDKITATATDAGNNTSEFGPNIVTAGITVTPVGGLTTTEAGGTAQFTVVLDSQPTADVIIGISSSDTTEGTVSTSSLTFTSANWNTPQVVTVTGVDDLVADGDIAYTIITAPATSADLNYNGLDASDVSLVNIDNETTTIVATDHPAGSVYGQTIYLTATVSASLGAGTPTGTVQFQIDGSNFGSAVLLNNGTASIGVNSLRAVSHNVTAIYDSDNAPTFQNSQTVSAIEADVTPVSLTITADSKSKGYGSALPTLSASYSGFVNGDTAASLTTLPTLSTTATAASHVSGNPYTITASGAADSDYTITYVSGSLTVTPVSLTIT